jgi:hypothetical protein
LGFDLAGSHIFTFLDQPLLAKGCQERHGSWQGLKQSPVGEFFAILGAG